MALVAACLAATMPVRASLLDGQTVATTNFHGSQPDQTQIYGPVYSVVGPGVELTNFGVTVFVNGQPMPGVFNIDFSDTNILVTLNANQPFSYFEVLRFADAGGTIPPYTVSINAATNWNGFNESDIYISPQFDFFQINLTALNGLQGQQISLDLAAVPQPVNISSANPPLVNPYLLGQQPFRDVLDTGPTSMLTRGIGGAGTPPAGSVNYSPIRVTFSGPILPAPAPVNVRLSCTYTSLGPSGMTECPTVTNIVSVGANTFEFHLTSPIPPGGCTTLTLHATQRVERLRYEFMPGDVTMDGTANTQDLLALVQAMRNGVANLPANLPRYNINRSTGPGEPVNTQDLLRLVQLLNGINTTQVWNGAALVPCP
jgi:hypothetical protein